MNNTKRKISTEFFHTPPNNYNCAQAILKGFESQFHITEEEILEYKAWGGGRAENGVCGALFAAERLLAASEKGAVRDEFQARSGAVSCKDLKALKFPCKECVRLADELVASRLNE